MDRHRIKPGLIVALAAGLLPLLLVLGAQKGTGQEKSGGGAAAAKTSPTWTAESHDRTNFPLVGRHRTLSCRECHVNNVFEGTPRDCEVCHWQRRRDDRYALRLGTRCADCHTPQAWKKVDPAGWSHETETGFRLEGVHRTLDCETCHGGGGFEPRPTDCYSCHEADYRGTREPNHAEAGFATECRNCHRQRAWSDASFSHDFPIQSGNHAGLSCSECHKSSDFRSFACIECHTHDQSDMDSQHRGVTGYAYSSLACYACHPRGQNRP